MMARPAGSGGKNGTAAAPAARSGPAPRTLTEMPRAGWLAILKRSIREFKHDDITDRAAALTYYGVLALFPAVLVLVSNVVTQVQGKAGAAGVAGIIGIVIALWSASGYVAAFMRASNAIYDVDEGRPVWKTGPVRLLTTLAPCRHARDRRRDRGADRADREPGRHGLRHRPRGSADLGHREMAGAGGHRQRDVLAAV